MTTPLNRRNALRMASAAAVGAGATVGLAAPARAARRARTLTLTGRRASANIPDVLTTGTPYFVHYELLDTEGSPAGTESAHCLPVTVGTDGALVIATLVLRLADGTLTAATAFPRPLPALTEVLTAPRQWSHTFAVTGGTGAYDGATGEITIDHISREEDVLTVTLG
ncbi:hypothetical protein [Kitasatospora sp. NPDC002965]|uniref:hypothetical protein n=1 Tax=Kitasatospora sp. NPDC002965 TaxID=3154775 RepID=UPI0033AC5B37